jgi:hypothetical protein
MPRPTPINDRVPEEIRNKKYEEYCRVRTELEQNLACPEMVLRYATHEAGHLLYWEKTGIVSRFNVAVFEGSTIFAEGDEICSTRAGVGCYRLPDYTEELLKNLSLIAVAGSLIEAALLGSDEYTDKAAERDEFRFQRHCTNAHMRNYIDSNPSQLWKRARDIVEHALVKDPLGIESRVNVLRPIVLERCFGM